MSTDTGAPRWRQRAEGARFGPVLALLVASLIVGAVLPTRLSALAVSALGIALWLAVARATEAAAATRRSGVAGFLVVAAAAGGPATRTACGGWPTSCWPPPSPESPWRSPGRSCASAS